MARGQLTVQDLPSNGKLDSITWTAANSTDDHYVTIDGSFIIILARNSNASTRTVALVSTADQFGRTGDITATVAGISSSDNGFAIIGVVTPDIFNSSGQFYINPSADAGLSLAAVRVKLPR